VREKVWTAPGAILLSRTPRSIARVAESRSLASHDSRPVTVSSVESCTRAVRDRPFRGSSVPLAMVPEMFRSCPEVMISGARESTESVTWPSIIWAVAGAAVA